MSQFFSFSFSSFFLPSLPPYLFSPKGREQHWEDSPTYSDLEFCAVLQSQLSPIQEGTRTPGRGDAGFILTNDHLDHRWRDHTEKHLPLCFVTSPGDHPFMVTLRLRRRAPHTSAWIYLAVSHLSHHPNPPHPWAHLPMFLLLLLDQQMWVSNLLSK